MNIAEHVALEVKVPVGVFSLEMTAERLVVYYRAVSTCATSATASWPSGTFPS